MEHEWLLGSIRRCGRRGGTLRDIVATGDHVNHAVFTRDEIRTGLAALLKSGKWFARKRPGSVGGPTPVGCGFRKTPIRKDSILWTTTIEPHQFLGVMPVLGSPWFSVLG